MFKYLSRYAKMIMISSVGSTSAQLLQFGPLVRIMEQNGDKRYVPWVIGAFWLGALLTSFQAGKLLDRIGPHKMLLLSLPIIVCPWGYLFTDYEMLMSVRFVQGMLISFLSTTLQWMLRRLLPEMEADDPKDIKRVLTAGDPHKKGFALNATLSTWVGTLVFSFLGYIWVAAGWNLVGWAAIASCLFLLTIRVALWIPKEELEQRKKTTEPQPQPEKKVRTKQEKKENRKELFFRLIPGIGMGALTSVFATYLPLYTTMVVVPLIMLVMKIGENVGVWLVAYTLEGKDQYAMASGIIFMGLGTLLLWMSSQFSLLVISALLLGVGVSVHRTTFDNSLYRKANPQQQGTAVAISKVAFNIACLIGSVWGVVAGVVGIRGFWLATLVWLTLPIFALVREMRNSKSNGS